jgi:hypothetical protein
VSHQLASVPTQFRPANKRGRKALLTALVWCGLLRHPPFGSDSYLTRRGARLAVRLRSHALLLLAPLPASQEQNQAHDVFALLRQVGVDRD